MTDVLVVDDDLAYIGVAQEVEGGYTVTSAYADKQFFTFANLHFEPKSLKMLDGKTLYSVDVDGSSITRLDCPNLKVERLHLNRCTELTFYENGPLTIHKIEAQHSGILHFNQRDSNVGTFDLSGCSIDSFKNCPVMTTCVVTLNARRLLFTVGRVTEIAFRKRLLTSAQSYSELESDLSLVKVSPTTVFRTKLALVQIGKGYQAKLV